MDERLELAIAPRVSDLGEGFAVRRLLPFRSRRMVGPFIFFDHFGPVAMPPGSGMDVRPHPHIGLSTLTYLYEGEILHRDSLGVVQPIRPGAVNWMTAGHGIVHSERSPPEARAAGPRLHGLQFWVALPRDAEEADPDFAHHPADSLPELGGPELGGPELDGPELDGPELDGPELGGRGVQGRLLAGRLGERQAPVAVFSDLFCADLRLTAEGRFTLPAEHAERAVYATEGAITLDGRPAPEGALLVLRPGLPVVIAATGGGARVVLFGGAPLAEPRHIWWNLVASDPARIEAAKRRWAGGGFPEIPGESEPMPLPEPRSRPPVESQPL